MQKQILLLTILFFSAFQMKAQSPWIIDSVQMGAGTINDVFYSMDNGINKAENNKNWHLAFSMNSGDSSAIWANHNAGNAFVKVYNIHKDKSQWASISISDTASADLCYNYDQLWSQGALNDIYSPNVMNFGWGTYDMIAHKLIGDSIFVIVADSSIFKVMIDSLEATTSTYYFRVGDLVNNTSTSHVLAKDPKYTNTLFAHFNLKTGMDTLREPNKTEWDILFTKYNTLVSQGAVTMPYSVVGVLGNNLASFAQAQNVEVDTAYQNYGVYTNPWSKEISVIGYDWKSYTGGVYVIPDSNTYFIKTTNNAIYQMQFLNYVSANGNFVFRKRLVIPTKVNDLSAVNQYAVFPNPTQGNLNVVLDINENTNAIIQLTDFSGRVVYTKNIQLQQGLNALLVPTQSIANGQYIVNIQGENIKMSEKVIVAK